MEDTLLKAIHEDPGDALTWMVLADWLEEQGDLRGELVRLFQNIRQHPQDVERPGKEARIRELLLAGVQSCVPWVANSLGMILALVPQGEFIMGGGYREEGTHRDEHPLHEVLISRPFYLASHPVTQEQYQAVIGENPSIFASTGGAQASVQGMGTRSFPVENVTWEEAVRFCQRLSANPWESEQGRTYRLPTEAEWEYACRGAGTSSAPHHLGLEPSPDRANFDPDPPGERPPSSRYLGRTTAVGSYPPNVLGLYDMHGNVCEWCQDRYSANYYIHSPRKDPRGPSKGATRIIRGGSWDYYGSNCRAAYRNGRRPSQGDARIGFRVVLDLARE
jgi:uncharacterized protein (TIGR02996 family)